MAVDRKDKLYRTKKTYKSTTKKFIKEYASSEDLEDVEKWLIEAKKIVHKTIQTVLMNEVKALKNVSDYTLLINGQVLNLDIETVLSTTENLPIETAYDHDKKDLYRFTEFYADLHEKNILIYDDKISILSLEPTIYMTKGLKDGYYIMTTDGKNFEYYNIEEYKGVIGAVKQAKAETTGIDNVKIYFGEITKKAFNIFKNITD